MFRCTSRCLTGRELSFDFLVAFHHTDVYPTSFSPTCGQQIRRHWQALSLSVRFSIFRVQRRLKRKFGA
jgi:hypothetical protein